MAVRRISGLYLITMPVADLFERVELALRMGVRILQYRGKEEGLARQRQVARELRRRCRMHGALFIVNDSIELARECAADGVHLGQGDGNVAVARNVLGADALVGLSTHCLAEAGAAEEQGADYIGFGCLFPTGTKTDTTAASLDELRRVRRAVRLPIVGIGGIHADNAAQVLQAGADAVAVISAVMQAEHPASTIRRLLQSCETA